MPPRARRPVILKRPLTTRPTSGSVAAAAEDPPEPWPGGDDALPPSAMSVSALLNLRKKRRLQPKSLYQSLACASSGVNEGVSPDRADGKGARLPVACAHDDWSPKAAPNRPRP